MGGAAVATAGAGLALNLAARSKKSEFDGSCETTPDGAVRSTGTLSPLDCKDCLSTFEDYRRWSIVGYISGAALAVTSGILFLDLAPVDPPPTAPPPPSSVRPDAGRHLLPRPLLAKRAPYGSPRFLDHLPGRRSL